MEWWVEEVTSAESSPVGMNNRQDLIDPTTKTNEVEMALFAVLNVRNINFMTGMLLCPIKTI